MSGQARHWLLTRVGLVLGCCGGLVLAASEFVSLSTPVMLVALAAGLLSVPILGIAAYRDAKANDERILKALWSGIVGALRALRDFILA